ncbi:hypothetical protein [Actinokineospora terrae]|uniref:Uncharacterized protein n=1 Tax=Actinokineospora terrae TaxID=155974 RepID=A0A1H9XSL0_9PSEU|nr:hypothetical protein [Actinokineospora terrae]SES49131.1 hypothetical protein SAMN04487818_12439 [Actinokineospora terrae]
MDAVDAAVELAATLRPLPLEYPDTVTHIAALLAGDPRNRDQVRAVVEIVIGDALADPFWETTANRWRSSLPHWVRPPWVGATVRRLAAAGVLVATGRYARSTDAKGGNGGKLQPIYALNLDPVRRPDPASVVEAAVS